jgi:hypothetical protein
MNHKSPVEFFDERHSEFSGMAGYDLTRGLITIPGRRGAEPFIDVQSETDIRGYHNLDRFKTGPFPSFETTVKSELSS